MAIVSEAAVSATPPERRPWVTAGEVSRRLDPALVLAWDLTGEALLAAMSAQPGRPSTSSSTQRGSRTASSPPPTSSAAFAAV